MGNTNTRAGGKRIFFIVWCRVLVQVQINKNIMQKYFLILRNKKGFKIIKKIFKINFVADLKMPFRNHYLSKVECPKMKTHIFVYDLNF